MSEKAETQKKTDTRVQELMASEEERRENQREFLDEISRNKLDVEKAFNEWTKRFTVIEERAETLTSARLILEALSLDMNFPPQAFNNNFSANWYLSLVPLITSAGNRGGSEFLSQSVVSRKSRTYCLSNDSCERPI